MNAFRIASRWAVAVALSIVMAGGLVYAQGQNQKQKPFQPEVGQAGKDVVWVPTPQALVEKMLDMAKVTPDDFVMDLGSGDGRTVITAAKRGATALGVEYNPDMVELSRANAAREGVTAKATFMKADLFETDLSKASVITMFLLPSINMKLRPKLLDLKPGTRIVSNSFSMEDWKPDETQTIDNCDSWCTAMLWIIPAKVDGKWRAAQGDLALMQEFQYVTGTVTGKDGHSLPITDGRLRGDQITFTVNGVVHTGRVNGDTMEGSANGSSWKATRTR